MKTTQPIVETQLKEIPRVVPETSTALGTGMFHPIGGLDPDINRGPQNSRPRVGFWSRFRAPRS